MKNAIGQLMQQAQRMQENAQKAQEELAALEVNGEAGGGMVKVVMNGRKEMLKIAIDPSLLGDDRDMLEDLVVAAVNDAVRRADKLKDEKMAGLTSGIPLPPGFKLPF
ncbi:YbaB/EbfC family nucleoid-associated protein [Methylogaea oryzae]|uniref:Nucleoid-associated protein MoryE10_23590 n=1 Tax=Methylogaea oryzae TaxID=1295382 RepID=A0A8D4VP08_9GAMM|nr:YbaB/EbfC family nucleoid-associated protein [Methylogaea oryzae]BBL71753.1 nucleoid-associated protein [Methylogaea oryzae]